MAKSGLLPKSPRISLAFQWCGFLLIILHLLGTASARADESADARFLAGLRERGLYPLAEAYCAEQLGREDLTEARRAELTIELSRAVTEQAVSAAPAEREPLWRKALGVLDEYLKARPDGPRSPLVKFQQALTFLTRGELAREEAELSGANSGSWEEARTQLREAIRLLQELETETAGLLRQINSAAHKGDSPIFPAEKLGQSPLTSVQGESLLKSIRYELSRAMRNQALCYPPESADRANSLMQALKLLDPLARSDAGDRLTWRSRLDRMICFRLLQDYDSAGAAWEQLDRRQIPPEFAARYQAERIRLALAKKDVKTAIQMLETSLKGTVPFSLRENRDSPLSAELELAGLETCLAAWREASDKETAKAWQQKAEAVLQRLDALYGPYWFRRGEMMLAGQIRSAPESGDLAMLIRVAENAFRSGRLDEALAAFDRASAAAEKEGNSGRAFDLAYTAATIEHERNRREQAMVRYRRLALAHPQHAKAAEAHQLAVYHAGQILYKAATGGRADDHAEDRDHRSRLYDVQAPDDFVMLLREHLKHWPEDPANDVLRRRLGGVLELQRRWPEALAVYQSAGPNDPKFAENVEAAERCCRSWFESLRSSGKPADEPTRKAAQWFDAAVLTPDGRAPERFGPAARAAVVAGARIRLAYVPASADQAERLLAAAIGSPGDAPAEWISVAQSLLMVALAQQGKTEQARALLPRMAGASPSNWLELLEGLRRAAEQLPEGDRKPLAELELQAIKTAEGDKTFSLAPGDSPGAKGGQTWERIRAQALADAGRAAEALEAYQSLEGKFPGDLGVVEAHARLLLDRPDGASQTAALARWQTIAVKSRPGSPAWLRAQYALALIHYRQGKKAEAARDIRIVELSYPELGGPELKRQYLDLLERCRK